MAIGPAIEPMSNPGKERVVDRGMAESAGDADARHVPVFVEGRLHADDRVLSKKLLGSPRPERVVDEELCKVQPVHVDLETETERRQRRNVVQHDLVETSRVSPELLVAE